MPLLDGFGAEIELLTPFFDIGNNDRKIRFGRHLSSRFDQWEAQN